MSTFVIHGHDVPISGDISLSNLPASGRLDLLSRCVTDALLVSHGMRDDVAVLLVLNDEYTIRFDGDSLRDLHPDERSTAARIVDALDQHEEAVGHMPVETSPGVFLKHVGFEHTLTELAEAGTIYQLHPDGKPVTETTPPEDGVFVLSDHGPFTEADEAILEGVDARRLSVGPRALHASQAITVVHNWLDTAGYSSY